MSAERKFPQAPSGACPPSRQDLRTGASQWRAAAIDARASNDPSIVPVPGEDGPQAGSAVGRRTCMVLVWIAAAVVLALRLTGHIV